MVHRLFVDPALLLRIGEQRLDFRRERDAAVVHAVIKRLDADPIPNQPQLTLARIPQRNRKHAAEAVQALDAPLLECVEDDFRIGVIRLPRVPADGLELAADLGVVVNLAVEDDLQQTVLIAHRLVRDGRQVDDREAAMPQSHPLVG